MPIALVAIGCIRGMPFAITPASAATSAFASIASKESIGTLAESCSPNTRPMPARALRPTTTPGESDQAPDKPADPKSPLPMQGHESEREQGDCGEDHGSRPGRCIDE